MRRHRYTGLWKFSELVDVQHDRNVCYGTPYQHPDLIGFLEHTALAFSEDRLSEDEPHDPIDLLLSSPILYDTSGKRVRLLDTPTKELCKILESAADRLHEIQEKEYNHPDPSMRKQPWKRPRTFFDRLIIVMEEDRQKKGRRSDYFQKLIATIDARRARWGSKEVEWLACTDLKFEDLQFESHTVEEIVTALWQYRLNLHRHGKWILHQGGERLVMKPRSRFPKLWKSQK